MKYESDNSVIAEPCGHIYRGSTVENIYSDLRFADYTYNLLALTEILNRLGRHKYMCGWLKS